MQVAMAARANKNRLAGPGIHARRCNTTAPLAQRAKIECFNIGVGYQPVKQKLF